MLRLFVPGLTLYAATSFCPLFYAALSPPLRSTFPLACPITLVRSPVALPFYGYWLFYVPSYLYHGSPYHYVPPYSHTFIYYHPIVGSHSFAFTYYQRFRYAATLLRTLVGYHLTLFVWFPQFAFDYPVPVDSNVAYAFRLLFGWLTVGLFICC